MKNKPPKKYLGNPQFIQSVAGCYTITTCDPIEDGKYGIYVGHSTAISLRWVKHIGDLMANKHHAPKLQEYFNSNGGLSSISFKCYDANPTLKDLKERRKLEKFLIEEFQKLGFVVFNEVHNKPSKAKEKKDATKSVTPKRSKKSTAATETTNTATSNAAPATANACPSTKTATNKNTSKGRTNTNNSI